MLLCWQLFGVIHQMMEWERKLERWGEQEEMQICWGRERTSWWNISWAITPRFSWSLSASHTFLCFLHWEVTLRLCALLNFKFWWLHWKRDYLHTQKISWLTSIIKKKSIKSYQPIVSHCVDQILNPQPTLVQVRSTWATLSGRLISLSRHFRVLSRNTNTLTEAHEHAQTLPSPHDKGEDHLMLFTLCSPLKDTDLYQGWPALCPTFLPSNMPLSYGAPADAP